jgi:hypothetical protein
VQLFKKCNNFGAYSKIYSERQKYGINSLEIKIPSRHSFSSYDVIDSFFKLKPPIFVLDSDRPFNCLNASIKILLSYIRKFLRKK